MSRRSFRYFAAFVVVLALAVRIFYASDVKTTGEIRGDTNDYVSYALNLKRSGVFSSTPPTGDEVRPDSYRGPGYPLFLAAIMSLAGDFRMELRPTDSGQLQLVAQPSTWIFVAYLVQSILGALTAGLGMLLARFWMARGPALAVGVLIALWPHLIVFSATLLSETLFGFLLIAALVTACFAEQRRSFGCALVAAALFALAYLVNPVIGAFPFLAAALLALRRQPASAAVFVVIFALAPGLWAVRNHFADVGDRTSLMRAEQNFVEGSWPQYHQAINMRFTDAIAADIMKAIGDEEHAFIADPSKGLAEILSRMADDPMYYVKWYLLDKPLLLWDWRIRIGSGDITFLQMTHDPFEANVMLRWDKTIFRWLNPVVLALAFVAVLFAFVRKLPFAAQLCVWFFLYVTAVHDVFQAEPRYAIPYRPEEVVLAMCGAVCIVGYMINRRNRAAASS